MTTIPAGLGRTLLWALVAACAGPLVSATAGQAATLGALTPLNCFSSTGVTGCISEPGLEGVGGLSDGVAVSPDGRSVYVVASKSTLAEFAVQSDGSLTYLTCIGDTSLGVADPCPVAAPGIQEGEGGGGQVVVSPDGADVYVTGFHSNTVAVFRRETSGPTLGLLSSDGCLASTGTTTCDAVSGSTRGQAPGLGGAYALALSPDGSDLYVAGITSETVAVLKRDTSGLTLGKLSSDGCLANQGLATCNAVVGSTHGQAPGLRLPDGLAVSPDGADVYETAAFGMVAVLKRDTGGVTSGRLSSDGCLAETAEVTCDAVAGSTHGQAPGIGNPQQPVVSPDGADVYVTSQAELGAFKRDTGGPTPGRLASDGCLTIVGFSTCDAVAGNTHGQAPAIGGGSLAISPDGANVYVTGDGDYALGVLKRDTLGGLTSDGCVANVGRTICDAVAGETHGQAAGLDLPEDLALSPSGTALYVGSEYPGSVSALSRYVPPVPNPPGGGVGTTPTPIAPTTVLGSLPPPPVASFVGSTLLGRVLTLDDGGGRVSLRVRCAPTPQGAPCSVRADLFSPRGLLPAVATAVGKSRKPVHASLLGKVSFSIPAGKTVTEHLRLHPGVLAATHQAFQARLLLSSRSAEGQTRTYGYRVTVRGARKKR